MADIINDIDELIGKYLAKEASPEEVAFIRSWMEENETNRKRFEQLRTIFDNAASVKNIPHFDTDAAWNKLRAKIKTETRDNVRTLKPDPFSLIWRIAASVILVVGVGYFAMVTMRDSNAYKPLEVATKTETLADTLPEGTTVFLNKTTQLAYSFDKKEKKHVVNLKGEAYFNISHDKNKTFIVQADEVYIKDIGTAFNVKAYPDQNTIEVAVEEGEVIIYTDSISAISILAGQKGIYNKITKSFSADKPEPNVISYKTKQFTFNDSNLGQVVSELNSIYDKRIVISSHLKNCRLTVSFQNEDIDEIALVIAETLGLSIIQSGGDIMLEGRGCEE